MLPGGHQPASLNAVKISKKLAQTVANIELDYVVRFEAARELIRTRRSPHVGTIVALIWTDVVPPTHADFDLVADAFAVERELASLPTQSFQSPAMGEAGA